MERHWNVDLRLGLGNRLKQILLPIVSGYMDSVSFLKHKHHQTDESFLCFSMTLKPTDVWVLVRVQLILDCHWLSCVWGEGLTDRSITLNISLMNFLWFIQFCQSVQTFSVYQSIYSTTLSQSVILNQLITLLE